MRSSQAQPGPVSLQGQTFGQWFVKEHAPGAGATRAVCSCGAEHVVPARALRGGKTKRCKACRDAARPCGRGPRPKARALPAAVEAEVTARYQAGEDSVQLGKAYGVNSGTILLTLRRQGVRPRSRGEAHAALAPEQRAAAVTLYSQGVSAPKIGEELGVSSATVYKALKQQGACIRPPAETRTGLTAADAAEICRRYTEGETQVTLAEVFGISTPGVGGILRKGGVRIRSFREVNRMLTEDQEQQICIRYGNGESTYSLGSAYGVSATTIGSILKRNAVPIRSPRETKTGLTADSLAEIRERYLAGENTVQLGKAYGVSTGCIRNTLVAAGVTRRESGSPSDTVQHALDGTGNFQGQRECEFYLYELARFSRTHCKVGISFDADVRAALGGGEYGEAVLRQWFGSRLEAYFLEQAVLAATGSLANAPAALQGWCGASEIRACRAGDLLSVVQHYLSELDELGVWGFGARHVPMTPPQRAACEFRSREEVA